MSFRRFVVPGLIIVFAVAGIAYANRGVIREFLDERRKANLPTAETFADVTNTQEGESAGKVESPRDQPSDVSRQQLPVEFNLDVPFTVQAPHANWDLPYKEACEEAAALMVHFFYTGKSFTDADHADQEIRKLIDFETGHYGFYEDTTAEEAARFIRDAWGYKKVEVIPNPTIEAMKREVVSGRPVILPAAGRSLGNPYFRHPGPLYHMLVVRGWTKDGKIITNDPGTRRGEGYLYAPNVLLNAVHDWNAGDVEHGRKVMIVVHPN